MDGETVSLWFSVISTPTPTIRGIYIKNTPPLIKNTPLVYYNLRPVGRRKFRCFPCTFKTIFNVSRAFWERCKTVFDKKISFWSLEFLKIFACGALTGSILQWYKRPLSLVNSTILFRTCTLFQSVYYAVVEVVIVTRNLYFVALEPQHLLKASFTQW